MSSHLRLPVGSPLRDSLLRPGGLAVVHPRPPLPRTRTSELDGAPGVVLPTHARAGEQASRDAVVLGCDLVDGVDLPVEAVHGGDGRMVGSLGVGLRRALYRGGAATPSRRRAAPREAGTRRP
jgi:hypothetical protein